MTQTNLKKLAQYRKQMQNLENKISQIMDDAIIEAVDISANKPNKVVFRSEDAKIVLVLRRRRQETTTTKRIQEDILAEIARLSEANLLQVQQLTKVIDELEAERQKLLTSPYLKRLEKELEKAVEESIHLVPHLQVFVDAIADDFEV